MTCVITIEEIFYIHFLCMAMCVQVYACARAKSVKPRVDVTLKRHIIKTLLLPPSNHTRQLWLMANKLDNV